MSKLDIFCPTWTLVFVSYWKWFSQTNWSVCHFQYHSCRRSKPLKVSGKTTRNMWKIRIITRGKWLKKILVTFFKEISKNPRKNLKNLKKKNPKNLKKGLKNPKNLRKPWKKSWKKSQYPKNLEKSLKNHKNLQKNLSRFKSLSLYFELFAPRIIILLECWKYFYDIFLSMPSIINKIREI